MAGTSGHRVLDVLDVSDVGGTLAVARLEQRVVFDHRLVHTVEGDVAAVRGEVPAFVDVPFAAVDGLAEDNNMIGFLL